MDELWEEIRKTYVNFLKDMPFIGGRKNAQARGVYDSIALLAYYEAVPDKPEFEEMSNAWRTYQKKHLCAWCLL